MPTRNPAPAKCPFCGRKTDWLEAEAFFGMKAIWFVVCNSCGTRGPVGHDQTDARRRWNRVAAKRGRK